MPVSLVIACISQKGGVGKSTLARLIAQTYAKGGWQVKIADFNTKQKTSVDWTAARMQAGIKPEIHAEPVTSMKQAMRQDYDLLVVDGRPDSDSTTLEIAKEADLCIIPTGTTLDDLKPQVLLAHELRARGISTQKMHFVLNKVTESEVALREAIHYIHSAGYTAAGISIPFKTGFQIAQNQGLALTETLYTKLNERAMALAAIIVAHAKHVKEKAA